MFTDIKDRAWLTPVLPTPRGKQRVDNQRVLSGIIFVLRTGLPLAGCAGCLWFAQDALHPLEKVEQGVLVY